MIIKIPYLPIGIILEKFILIVVITVVCSALIAWIDIKFRDIKW